MITRVLRSRGSSASVLDYNEKKVFEEEATAVFAHKMDAQNVSDVYNTLEQRDNNPFIRNNVRSKVFHMTVCPGPEDAIDEEAVLYYINDIMIALGYGEQPFIVYRHNDIAREHYHIVSSRILPNGKTVNNHFEGRRVNELQEQLAPKYGFVVGLNRKKLKELEIPQVITYGERYWPQKAIERIKQLSKYEFGSMRQFQTLLQQSNIHLRQMTCNGEKKENFVFWITDETGAQLSRLVSPTRMYDEDIYTPVMGRINAMKDVTHEPPSELTSLCRKVAGLCGTREELLAVLKEMKIEVCVPRRTDETKTTTVIDRRRKRVYDGGSVCEELSLEGLLKLESGPVNAARIEQILRAAAEKPKKKEIKKKDNFKIRI